ncbi:MAG: hypothetical protein DCF22_16710 [Leptolyngbya sp.]|nr:MAG: hypothetical protein DCF22_16710 [Leptolyngbya sp.]
MTNWAVIVGINHYAHLSPQEHLKFAVSDAERVKRFLCDQAGFSEDFVILCSDTSKPIRDFNTRPDSVNLRKILRKLSDHPNAQNADQAWFFFSGHGLLGKDNQNYLLTSNSDPEDLEHSAISVEFVIKQLIHCQAKNTVLVLDMCRNQAPSGSKGGSGFDEAQIVQQAQQNGIITIFSCSRGGKSYELPNLQQGAFTHAFLEGLQQHTILKQLDNYLRDKVYALTQANQPAQIPLIVPEPGWKYDRPLLPHCITKRDIETLKSQAIHAWIIEKNLDLAEQVWELVNDLATDPQDKKLSRQSLVKIAQERQGFASKDSSPQPNSETKASLPFTLEGMDDLFEDTPTSPREKPEFTLEAMDDLFEDTPTSPTVASIELNQDDLSSEKGIEYRNLRDLLKAGKWKEADQETADRMCEAMGRQQEGWLRVQDVKAFPCIDLQTIERLWLKYSQGKFGFSVQRKVWQECGSPTETETWKIFCDQVGWRKDGK